MAGRPKEKTVEAIDRLLAFEDLRNLKARYLQYLASKQCGKYGAAASETCAAFRTDDQVG
jgi:hypothetical protein